MMRRVLVPISVPVEGLSTATFVSERFGWARCLDLLVSPRCAETCSVTLEAVHGTNVLHSAFRKMAGEFFCPPFKDVLPPFAMDAASLRLVVHNEADYTIVFRATLLLELPAFVAAHSTKDPLA